MSKFDFDEFKRTIANCESVWKAELNQASQEIERLQEEVERLRSLDNVQHVALAHKDSEEKIESLTQKLADAEKRVEDLREIGKHCHVAMPESSLCAECDRDLRHEIHLRTDE